MIYVHPRWTEYLLLTVHYFKSFYLRWFEPTGCCLFIHSVPYDLFIFYISCYKFFHIW